MLIYSFKYFRKMKRFTVLITFSLAILMFSCKKENKLEDRSLTNSYENFYYGVPGYELIKIDSSSATYIGIDLQIKICFHVDFSKIYDTTMIDKIIYTRNNSSGYLQHGQYTGCMINYIAPWNQVAKYDYRFAFKFKGGNNLISAYTPVYTVVP